MWSERTKRVAQESTIANLLSNTAADPAFPALDATRLLRVAGGLRTATALWAGSSGGALGDLVESVSDELEDLQTTASAPALEAVLQQVYAARDSAIGGPPDGGDEKPVGRFLVYRLGLSLETGEAEVASRGFYDVLDRPPILLWTEVLTRPALLRSGDFEVALLAFVPERCLDRAEAGRRACPNHSLSFVDEVDTDLSRQLAGLIAGSGKDGL